MSAAACICPLCGGEVASSETIRILPDQLMVASGDLSVALTPVEMDVLLALASAFPRKVDRGFIFDAVYWRRAGGEEPEDRIVDVYIHKLRRKMRTMPVQIDNQYGAGWSLVADGKPRIVKGVAGGQGHA
jgi:DNA-binding response OmpR family regulator